MKKIEIITENKSNNTKVTIATERVTLKISPKHIDRFSSETWKVIANKFSEIEVENSHRGMLNFLPYGFHSITKTENDKHKIIVTFYEELNEMVYKSE
jgi:hypothetical protein